MSTTERADVVVGPYRHGWKDEENYVFKPRKGLDEDIVREISAIKGEPQWMRDFRLKALKRFFQKPMKPWFAVNMPDLNFDDIYYYIKPTEKQAHSWDELPESVKRTYEKLGIPEAERKYLAGVTAQYECLPATMRVLTGKGMVALKDLKEGDLVFALDEGAWRLIQARVKAKSPAKVKNTIALYAGPYRLEASTDHPLLRKCRGGYEWVPASSLAVGDEVLGVADIPALDYVPDRGEVLLAWLAGRELGARLSICGKPLNQSEDLADRVVEALEKIGPIYGLASMSEAPERLAALFGLERVSIESATVLPREVAVALFKGAAGLTLEEQCVQEGQLGADLRALGYLIGVFSPLKGAGEHLAWWRIERIEELEPQEVFDLEIEGVHNFAAEGFIVHNSEVVYHRNRADLEAMGVIFCDMDTAVREHGDLVRQYFGKVIPPGDNKFAALNSAVWSGGSFIYVPPGVHVELPLQAYFRINAENMGQFERTLIIADEGSSVHYIEGCSAPIYSTESLHAAVVELVALRGARITYTTIQNWSTNVYNLVTKRARAEAEARVEWIDGNIGSKLTMKYPSVFLMGPKASGEVLSVAYAGRGQHQDAGAKMHHCAPETTSQIISKSISKDGGKTTYRGKVEVQKGARNAKAYVRCDALILDEESVSETKPTMEVNERDASIGHEATVAKIGEEQVYYLMSRGLTEQQAMSMVVNGFIEPITRTLPMEYAVEWSRLIELQMEGAIG